MQKKRILTSSAASLAFALTMITSMASTSVLAQESNSSGARLEGELSVEFETDHVFKSDDPASEATDSYPTIELGASWIFNQYFSVNGAFVAEPVQDPTGDRMFFEDVGIYTGELYAHLQLGQARLFAGKFGATFGQAWDLTPGLYSTGFAEDYELAERVGLGVGWSAQGTVLGNVDLTGNVFTMDTSALSGSIFTNRPRATLADGGAGNTGELDSFSVTLDGRNLPMLSGIAWHLGYSHQEKEAKDNGNLSDETGLVAGLYGSHKLSENTSLEWVGEIAQIQNAGGGANDVTYYTLGGVVTFAERYNLALAHTTRAFDVAGGANYNDTQTQISAGMEIYDGWTVDIGYKIAEEGGVESQTVGVLLAKTFAFNTGQ